MAIEKFKFVSPGVQINEIDETVRRDVFPVIGPVVIGTTAKGPSMQPVVVNRIEDLEKIFGSPSNGKVGTSDVWRTGTPTSPTFATYAAKAFLRNSNPVTVIRLAGVEMATSGESDKPGWSTEKVFQIFGVANATASLLANVYASSSTNLYVLTGSDTTTDWNTHGTTSVTSGKFQLKVGTDVYDVSLNSNDSTFIRNVLNTNPTKYDHPLATQKTGYFLGESFEFSTGSISGFTSIYLTSSAVGDTFKNFNGALDAETGWVIDDVPSNAAIAAGQYNKLFKFTGLNNGSTLAKDIKISIENVRATTNPNVTQYGTFDVVVRKLYENSNTSSILERFVGLSLDETADNYIARRIGDSYRKWNINSNRYEEYGTFSNKSAYIRVVMDEASKGQTSLPHGFEMTGMPTLTGSLSTVSKYVHPNITLNTTTYSNTQAKAKRFGLVADAVKNADLVDVLSYKQFSTTPTVFHMRHISSSLTSVQYVDTYYNSTNLLTKGNVLGFDMPFYGGTDGKNILKEEAFVDNLLLASGDEYTNAAYRAVKRAIDMVAEAEAIDMNVLCVPNLKNPDLTSHMLEICRTRGDTLALIDLEEDYMFSYETGNGKESRPQSVLQVIENLQSRQIDNSYGAAYFPAVFVPTEGIFMPSSIAALGALAGTEGRQALWFAPAGFNRGGLTEATSGIGVSRTALHLVSSDRDQLYSANINPIATFPNEGVVIFGQKTLQVTPSALDRVNVRRLLNFIKKEISRVATRVLFEPNVEATWNSFKAIVDPFLLSIKNAYGLDDALVVLDETTTTADLVDRNIMYCKIFIKPTRAIEYIGIDFIVTNSGAAFTEGQ